MDRRRFLELIALLTATPLWSACDGGSGAPDLGGDAGPDAGPDAAPELDVPFGIWRALLAGIRQSPDHLVARAEEAVATGDPARILAFVRDQIRLLTDTGDDEQEATETRMFWGAAAALRCGAGTARTRAELLAALYRQAGFEDAAVVVGPVDVRGAAAQALFLAGEAPAFAPALDPADLAAWQVRLGAGERPPPTPDEDAAESAALADALLAAVPDAWYRRARTIGTRLRRVPLVQLTVAGERRYANPTLPDVSFGESGTSAEPTPAPAPELPPVRVALSYTRTDTGDALQPLVERTWTADEVVGRQVRVQLVPTLGFDALVGAQVDDVRHFIPTLQVAGPALDVATGTALLALGDIIGLEGDRIRKDPATGQVTVDDEAVEPPAPDPSAALARVARLEIRASGSGFRRIGLRVRALDADGLSVAGLRAGDFQVAEEDAPQAHVLTASLGKPPRVLFFLDVSVSVPPAFRVEGAAAIARAVASEVVAAVPDAQFRIAALNSGYRLYGGWTGDPEALHTAALDAFSTSSALWHAAAESTRQQPTLIVMLTDGAVTDEPTDERVRRILAGPPIVGIHVDEDPAGAAFLNELAMLTHGGYFPVTQPEEAIAAIVGFLDIERETRYRLRYRAPEAGPDERRVRVATADGRLVAEGTYRVPMPAHRTPPPALTGFFLTVEASGRSVTRPLAGYDPAGPFAGPEDPAVAEQVRAFFFATTTLSFEGGAPTTAAWLDDILTARLSQEPTYRALAAGDLAAARQHIATIGLHGLHPELVAAHAPLPRSADAVTTENGLRVVLLTERPEPAARTRVEAIDLLDLTRFTSVAADPRAGYAATLRHTARRAIWEAARYGTSTVSTLTGVPLAPYDSGTRTPAFLRESALGARWSQVAPESGSQNRLVPADGRVLAWWDIHEVFGELRGLLADGSGGGGRRQQIEQEIAQIKSYLAWLKALYGSATLVGRGEGIPPQFSALIAYASALGGLYGTAAIVISTLSAAGADEAIRTEVAGLACNAFVDTLAFLPVWVPVVADIIEALTGASVCGALT